MSATTRPDGLDTDTELQRHLAELDAEAPAEDVLAPPVDLAPPAHRALQDVRNDIDDIRRQIDTIRSRLSVIRQQAKTVVTANAEWADASAHAQLGHYPWAKLAGAMAATFLLGRALRQLPMGGIATTAAALMVGQINARPRR